MKKAEIQGKTEEELGAIILSDYYRQKLECDLKTLLNMTDNLSAVGSRITAEHNPQTFKRHITWIFAALVGTVIIGFFIIAWRDEKIRRTIFSGDAGIQFLTLFSLVIAIILFGVTGVLGG